MKIYQEILKKLPPSTQNNARSYVTRKLGILSRYPSESRIQEMRDILDDFEVDYQNSDDGDRDLQIKE